MDDLDEIYKLLEDSAKTNNVEIKYNLILGDLVVVESWTFDKNLKVPQFGTLKENDEIDGTYGILLTDYENIDYVWWFNSNEFRLATTEEIKTGIIGSK